MLFYYVRHGEPIYSPDSLTPLGHRQAEAIAKRLAVYGLDEIYSSTSNRAIQTATPTAKALNKEIKLLDFANEGHAWDELTYQTDEGRRWLFHLPKIKELFHDEITDSLGHEWYNHPALKDYGYGAAIARIQNGADELFESLGYRRISHGKYEVLRQNDSRVALFAHQGFGLAFFSAVLGIPYPKIASHFDMCHSGLTVIEFKDEGGFAYPRVWTLSNDSHLWREGVPGYFGSFEI